jgi:DNA-binding NarL/FixJ family response regulator
MIRVILFEDNPVLRKSLAEVINLNDGFACVGDYPNCKNAVEVVGKTTPDVVLMDIDMPVVNGIEGANLIRQNFPSVKILMLTVFEDNDKVFNAICAGASGYLLKKSSPDKILEAIKEVKEGGAPMTPLIASKVLTMFQDQNPYTPSPEILVISEREKEILKLLVKGLSQKMIAAELFISANTVNFHIKNIYEKLHVHSVSEAVSKAIRNKIV